MNRHAFFSCSIFFFLFHLTGLILQQIISKYWGESLTRNTLLAPTHRVDFIEAEEPFEPQESDWKIKKRSWMSKSSSHRDVDILIVTETLFLLNLPSFHLVD